MDKKKNLIVIDLDGTIVKGNTLHLYIKAGIRDMVCRLRFADIFRSAVTLTRRYLGNISHTDMKYRMLSLINRDGVLRHGFKERVSDLISIPVLRVMDDYRDSGSEILIATAAPDIYMDVIKSLPGFRDIEIISSTYCSADGTLLPKDAVTECRGKEKALQVEKYLSSNRQRLSAIITDHEDDRPLINLAERSGSIIYLTGKKPPSHHDAVYL